MQADNWTDFNSTDICHICKEVTVAEEDNKVRDHCHICGQYRGPAHSKCNLAYFNNRDVPVVFHNLKGYDSHIVTL